MIHHEYVCQPYKGVTYRRLFEQALAGHEIQYFDVAVAYATSQGARALIDIMANAAPNSWDAMKKRWLIGIDWCRTDPTALDMLAQLPSSTLKIFDGERVVARRNCTPKLPFHPKGYMLRGEHKTAIIAGSGNLSRNGLLQGHEIGSVLVAGTTGTAIEATLKASCDYVCSWFDATWRTASRFPRVRDAYLRRYERADNMFAPAPTEDDAVDSEEPTSERIRRGSLTVDQLRKLRAARHFWIQFVRNPNRGAGVPGSQLMMSHMMRVFFGFPADDLPRDSPIGEVEIRYGSFSDEFSLRFSNNAMDVLNLPIPGREGPATYDGRVLLFEREASGRQMRFALSLGSAREVREWQRRSQLINASYRMTSGRPWGVF